MRNKLISDINFNIRGEISSSVESGIRDGFNLEYNIFKLNKVHENLWMFISWKISNTVFNNSELETTHHAPIPTKTKLYINNQIELQSVAYKKKLF